MSRLHDIINMSDEYIIKYESAYELHVKRLFQNKDSYNLYICTGLDLTQMFINNGKTN